MSRHDLANYLALAIETASRNFSDLRRAGVLDVNDRSIRILNRERLARIALVDAPFTQEDCASR